MALHGAQLIRAAPEHLRADMLDAPLSSESPGQALDSLRGRGTTTYLDLNRANRRSRDDVVSDDEADEPDAKSAKLPRLAGPISLGDAAPFGSAPAVQVSPSPTTPASVDLGLLSPVPDTDLEDYEPSEPSVHDEAMQPQLSMPPSVAEPGGEPDPVQDDLHPTFAPPAGGPETFQQLRARLDRQETISFRPPLGELHPTFTAPPAPETFQDHRARVDRQETISHHPYGPTRPVVSRATPYSADSPSASEAAFSCDVLPESGARLPCGWTYAADGSLSLGAIADHLAGT